MTLNKQISKYLRDNTFTELSKNFYSEGRIAITVYCLTYNHAPFIERCLESILMQKVNFRVKIIIHDDASTDGTIEIIKKYADKYPNIIFPIFEKVNQYSVDKSKIGYKVSELVEGNYVATCEGDDYWTDEYKLAIQYLLMEMHPECSLAVHKVKRIDARNGSITYYPTKKMNTKIFNRKNYFKLITSCYAFQTSSYFRRSSYYFEYVNKKPFFAKKIPTGDEASLMYYGLKGKILYIDREMSVYSFKNKNSWSSKFLNYNAEEKISWVNRWEDGLLAFDSYTNHTYKRCVIKKINNLKLHNLYYENIFREYFNNRKYRRFLFIHHPRNYFVCIIRYKLPKLYNKIKEQ